MADPPLEGLFGICKQFKVMDRSLSSIHFWRADQLVSVAGNGRAVVAAWYVWDSSSRRTKRQPASVVMANETWRIRVGRWYPNSS